MFALCLSLEIQGKTTILWEKRGTFLISYTLFTTFLLKWIICILNLIILYHHPSLPHLVILPFPLTCFHPFLSSGAGGADQLEPCRGGEWRNGVWKDHSGHPIHPRWLYQQRHGLDVSGGLHAASSHQCHLSMYSLFFRVWLCWI